MVHHVQKSTIGETVPPTYCLETLTVQPKGLWDVHQLTSPTTLPPSQRTILPPRALDSKKGAAISALIARPTIVIALASLFRIRKVARTQMRRRGRRQDRHGARPGVGRAGRRGDMGRHRRQTYVRAPESIAGRNRRENNSQGSCAPYIQTLLP